MTLKNLYKKFPTQVECIRFLESIVWEEGVKCPYCCSKYITALKHEERYHCNSCNISFSVTVNTFLRKTKIDLQKWFYVINVLSSNQPKISVRELATEINVTKDTANRLVKTIKTAFLKESSLINNILNKLNDG
ncbi:MAG: transposase [Bacteroidetes bacterium]|nr:transposase [Bacteroidota bacterium]